jgi:mitochondrial chaperone BCS1
MANSFSEFFALTGDVTVTNSTIRDILGNPTPGFTILRDLIASWLKLDITTLAAVLTILGTISGAFRDLQTLAAKAYWWITRFLTSSISIAGKDRLNREDLNWVGANVLTRQAPRVLTASSGVIQNEAWHYRRIQVERDNCSLEKRQPVQYLPTFGTTWFFFRESPFYPETGYIQLSHYHV